MQTYRRPYRRTTIRRYLTKSSKIFTRNATNTDDITDGLTDNYTDGIKSVGISQRVEKQLQQNATFTDGYTDALKSVGISQRVRKTCHHHRRDYRRIIVRRHLTVSSKIFRTKCHNHRHIHRRNKSVGNLSVAHITDRNTDGPRDFQSVELMRLWTCQIIDGITDGLRKKWRVFKNSGRNSNNTDGFLTCYRRNFLPFTDGYEFRRWVRR